MRLAEVDDGQLRRIPRVLAKTGAALALAGAAAGCAAPTHSAAAAAVKPPTPSASASASASASSVGLPSPPPSTSAPTTAPSTADSGAAPAPSTRAAVPGQVIAAKAAPGDPCSAAAVACVSLSRQEAWFVSGGKVVRGPIPVATGRAGYGTELGTFQVYRKNRMWYSTIYNNAPMPYSVFSDGGEAFHQGSTSVRSHGCVHVGASNASWIFNFLHIGDEVQVVR
jgi:lipoprotein-anchoring transpeptidase ErfK/SrfK